MTKFVYDTAMDAMLDKIADQGGQMVICEGAPSDGEDAMLPVTDSPGVGLGTIALTPGDGGGDYVKADGDTNGRKLTVSQQTGVPIDFSGEADHIAIVDVSDTLPVLVLVTEITTPQTVTAGNTATVNAFDDEVADPT